MRKILVGSGAILATLFSCKHSDDSEVAATRPTVGYYQGTEKSGLPLVWNVAGLSKAGCNTQLEVPPDLVQNLNVAWTEAGKLLKGVNLDTLDGPTNSAFKLTEVKVLVGSERVLYLGGCIGKTKQAAAEAPPGNYNSYSGSQVVPSIQGSLQDKCGVTSPAIEELKAKDLTPNQAGCADDMIAGFALRSTHREINLSATFSIQNHTYTYAMDPFDTTKLEIRGSVKASISSFGSALLPLPPGIKAAASALFERIGTPVFSAEAGSVNTITPDLAYTKANYPDGPGFMRVSKLAQKIANGILRRVCREAQPKIGVGIYEQGDCELRPLYPVSGLVETLEKYRVLPVVACEANGPAGSTFYAIAPTPKVVDQNSTPVKKETDFLALGANPSNFRIYQKKGGNIPVWTRVSWGT
jgi:hypothetical protein